MDRFATASIYERLQLLKDTGGGQDFLLMFLSAQNQKDGSSRLYSDVVFQLGGDAWEESWHLWGRADAQENC
jgi:hypothetical protein